MIIFIIRAKTFRTRKHFAGGNATMPPGFLGLWMADGINFVLEESGNGQILLGKNKLKTRKIEFCLLIWFSWLPPYPSFFVFVSVHSDSLYIYFTTFFFLSLSWSNASSDDLFQIQQRLASASSFYSFNWSLPKFTITWDSCKRLGWDGIT